MILKEGLYNKEFVSNHSFGFENWTDAKGREHLGFKEFILSEYETSRVSRRTGVPVDVIIRLAREFASNNPPSPSVIETVLSTRWPSQH